MSAPGKQFAYTVRGHWPFPTDMLRHDGSSAATADDQLKIDAFSTDHAMDRAAFDDLDINLVGPYKPNTARWESFGWAVPSDQEWQAVKRWREEDHQRRVLVASAKAKLTPEELEALAWARGQ